MSDPSIKQQPLHDLFNAAERLSRELSDHLEQGFLPKSHYLRRITRPSSMSPGENYVQDVTIRHHVSQVLDSEQFTRGLHEKLSQYLEAIDSSILRILSEGD